MSLDTDVATSDTRAGVYLQVERFNLIFRVLSLTSDAAIGKAIGMADKTIGRAREGVIGERFIAAVLSYLAEHEAELSGFKIGVAFEDVFEIRDKAVAA